MLKVIRLDKKEYEGKKHNNLHEINKELASVKRIFVISNVPSRRKFRKQFVEIANKELRKKNKNEFFPVSIRDIKRLEYPKKCEIPVNIVDILEILISEINKYKNDITYRATDKENAIISYYILTNTIDSLNIFKSWLKSHEVGERPECDKFREEVKYVAKRLEDFNVSHSQLFNELFD